MLHSTLNPNCHGRVVEENRVGDAVQVMDDTRDELTMLIRVWRNQVLLEGYGDFGKKMQEESKCKSERAMFLVCWRLLPRVCL